MATLEELFEEFKKLPDWERFPLPKCLYEKFNIPPPKPITIDQYFRELTGFETILGGAGGETRPPAEGGLRQMPELTDQNAVLCLQDSHEEKADSTESTESKSPESKSQS